jgi:Protein of Unknown function (DUF2784)
VSWRRAPRSDHTSGVLAAAFVAVFHGATVLFMLTGSLLALRRPRVLWLHVPVAVAILGLFLTGSDCPLTDWELRLRRLAGEPRYRGGFIGHYVTQPLGFPIHAPSTQAGILLIALLPNVIGYGLLIRRGLRGLSARRRTAERPDRSGRASPRSRPRPPATPASGRDR